MNDIIHFQDSIIYIDDKNGVNDKKVMEYGGDDDDDMIKRDFTELEKKVYDIIMNNDDEKKIIYDLKEFIRQNINDKDAIDRILYRMSMDLLDKKITRQKLLFFDENDIHFFVFCIDYGYSGLKQLFSIARDQCIHNKNISMLNKIVNSLKWIKEKNDIDDNTDDLINEYRVLLYDFHNIPREWSRHTFR
jgi:hypothetical protein